MRLLRLGLLMSLGACMAPSLVVDETQPVLSLEAPQAWSTDQGLPLTLRAAAPDRAVAWMRLRLQIDGEEHGSQIRRHDPSPAQSNSQWLVCLRLPDSAPCTSTTEDWLLPASFGKDGSTLQLRAEAADNATAQRAAQPVESTVLVKDRLPPRLELDAQAGPPSGGLLFISGKAVDGASGLTRLGYHLSVLGNGRLSQTVEGELAAFLPGGDRDRFVIPVAVPQDLRSGEVRVDEIWVRDGANPANQAELLEPPTICLGNCRDETPPRIDVLSVVWLRDEGNQTLSPGDGIHSGAELEVAVQAVDSSSGIDLIRIESPRERAEHRVPEESGSPGLVEITLRLRVPEGGDGETFDILASAFDDYGDLPDRNLGEADPFALELVDDLAPVVSVIGLVNEQGELLNGPPDLGDRVAVRLQADDPLGKLVGFTLSLYGERGDAALQTMDFLLDSPSGAGEWTTTERFELPADGRAMENWRIDVTATDDARVTNRSEAIEYPFLPRDEHPPVIDQSNGPATVNPGRSYSVTVAAHDVNRVVSWLGIDLTPQSTRLSGDPVRIPVDPAQAQASGQIPLIISNQALEGSFQIQPTATDDQGNHITGVVQNIELLDDVQPVIDSATFVESPIQPGIPVTLRVQASDLNSPGIAQVSIAWPRGMVDGQMVDLITANGAISVENPADFPVDFRGTVRADLAHGHELRTTVTVVDRAQAANSRQQVVLRHVDDRGGPSLSADPLDAVAGNTVTLTVSGLDNSGVRRLGYRVEIPNLAPGLGTTVRQSSQAFQGDQNQETAQFQIAVPTTAQEAVGNQAITVTLSGEDAVGNLSEGSTTLVIRDQSAPRNLSIQASATAATGSELDVTFSAADDSSGLDQLDLSLAPIGLTVQVDCQGAATCQATRSLVIPEDLSHGAALTLQLSARDQAAGGAHTSQTSRAVTVTDGSDPVLTLQAPAPAHVFTSEQNGTVSVQVHDPNSNITSWSWRLQCGRPGAGTIHAQGSEVLAQPGHTVLPNETFTMPHSGHCPSNATLLVQATNAAGRTGQVTRPVGIQDATDPTVTWRNGQSPDTAATGDSNVRFDGRLLDTGSGAGQLSITVPPCIDASPSSHNYGGQTSQRTSTFRLNIGTSCAPGQHILTLTGQDAAGNTSSAEHRLTIEDDDPPSIEFLGPPATVSVGTSVNLSLRLHDPSSGLNSLTFPSVPCGSLNGRNWNDNPTNATDQTVVWEIPADCRNLGAQVVTARISDASADSPDGELDLNLTILDGTPPSVEFTAVPTEIRLGASAELQAAGSDPAAGLATLAVDFAAGSGSFNPASQNFPANPTSGSLTSQVTGDAGSLRHGDQVRLRVTATDASNNSAQASSALLPVVDDLAPASGDIVITAAANTERTLDNGRFPVAAGESITLTVQGTDINSGITGLRYQAVWTGGAAAETENGRQGLDTDTFNWAFTVPNLAHGETITITPGADDVSAETGFTDGVALVLILDGEGPTGSPGLTTPGLAQLFGETRGFRCATGAATTLTGSAGAGIDRVKLTIDPLLTGFPAAGRIVDVSGGAWSRSETGWSNTHQAYTLTITALDEVGNEGPNPGTFSLRSDLSGPALVTVSSRNLDSSGRAVFRPQISGARSAAAGELTVARGRIHNCAGSNNSSVDDETPNDGSFRISQANTLNLSNNALSCSWEVEESFCERITTSTGTIGLTKANEAPSADQLEVQGDSSAGPTIGVLRPTFSGRYVDDYEADVNEISFAHQVQARVLGTSCPGGLASSVCWTSALRSVDLESGERGPLLQAPLWRPPLAAGPTEIISLRSQGDLLVIEPGTTTIRVLNLDRNQWSSALNLDDQGDPMATPFEGEDGLVIDENGNLVWLDSNGNLRIGTLTGSPLTQVDWTAPEAVTAFDGVRCNSVTITTSPVGANQLLVFCRGTVVILTNRLSVYGLDGGVNPPVASLLTHSFGYIPRTIGADYQVIRLPGTSDFRILRGSGFGQILAARVSTGPLAWDREPVVTGSALNTDDGCSIAAEGADGRYIVTQGGGTVTAWRIDSDGDTDTAMNLPAGLAPPQSPGQFLVPGGAGYEAVFLAAGGNLRPVSHDGSGAWLSPPTIGSEAALVHGGSYSWQVRFVDEGEVGGDFADAAQSFTISIP